MKLKVVLLAMLSTLCGVLSTNTNPAVTTNAATTTAIENVNTAQSYAGLSDASLSTVTDDGIKVSIPGADTVGDEAWTKKLSVPYAMDKTIGQSMDISNGKTVSIEFSISMYENNAYVTQSRKGPSFYFVVANPWTNQELCRLLVWVDSGGETNGNHSFVLYGTNPDGDGWINYGITSWVNGDATSSSSFYFEFNTTDFLKARVNKNTTDPTVPLHNNSETFRNQMNEALTDVNSVNFRIYGNNGFTNSCDVVVKKINGVSVNDLIMQDNINSVASHANLAYKYTATTTTNEETSETTTTYDNVEFRLLAGVDDKLASYASKHNATAYGVEVSRTGKNLQLEASKVDGNINYAVVSLKDMINNYENATVEITIKAYMVVDGKTFYSSQAKVYTVVGMIKTYHEQEKPVDGLYNIFASKGAYAA